MNTAEFELLCASLDPDTLRDILSSPRPWAETFLKNPTGGRFRATHVQELILGSLHRNNVVRVHRRAGKSYSIAVLTLFYCLMVASCQVLIITPAGSQVKELFTTLREFIRVNEWIQPYVIRNHENPHRIEFANGSRVTGFTAGSRSKGKGMNLRGQGADVIFIDEAAYLNEDDWVAIRPIMKGDQHRRFPPRVFCCSTPAYTRGAYYRMCLELSQHRTDGKRPIWHEIHVGILDNPSLTQEYISDAKDSAGNELEWVQEWLAEFPDLGEGVFPKGMVDKALVQYDLEDYLARAKAEARDGRAPSRTIGVDWDKFNEDGHGPNIAVLELTDEGKYRVIWWEEIPQSRFCLHGAVDRICELYDFFRPEWIYVDRGYGENQLEELELRGVSGAHPGLDKRVKGIQFKNSVECPLPGGGVEKKHFKYAMVALLRQWFEKGLLELPKDRRGLWQQFLDYHIVSQTENNLKFSRENEHGIDAVGLAAMAMHQKVKNPYRGKPATKCITVPAPNPVPVNVIKEGLTLGKSPEQTWRDLAHVPDTFSRRSLGMSGPTSRTLF